MATLQPSHQIQIVRNPSDLFLWTQGQYDAFINTDNVIHEALFPPATAPTPAQVEATAARHQQALAADSEHNVFIQILDPLSNEVMGGAKWQLWPKDPQRPADVAVDWVDTSTDEAKKEQKFAQRVMNEFQGRRARNMACPHALLDICFTTPKYERQGVATALVKWGLERADAEGWRAFTEASPRGRAVYERLGFEEREDVRLSWRDEDWGAGKGDVLWTFLERPPTTKRDGSVRT